MKKAVSFIVLLTLVVSWGCSKKEEVKPKTPQELLLGKWTFSSYLFEGKEAIEECEKDDTWEFKTGGVVMITESVIKCSPSDEDTDGSTSYTISQDGKLLSIGDDASFTILEINDTMLKLGEDGDVITLKK